MVWDFGHTDLTVVALWGDKDLQDGCGFFNGLGGLGGSCFLAASGGALQAGVDLRGCSGVGFSNSSNHNSKMGN